MLNEQVESVMAIAFELARIREEHGAQSGMYLSEVRALRAEAERLAAQAAPLAQQAATEEIEAVIACLGDDAAQLREENPEDERADNMDRAAEMLSILTSDRAAAQVDLPKRVTADAVRMLLEYWVSCGKPDLRGATTQAVRMLTVTAFNVGRFCLSEDDCIAQGIDFSAYERGVADAAEAFSRNT